MSNQNPTITIVEDNPDFMEFLEEKLKERYSVRSCVSIEEAEAAIDGKVDLVVLDLRLPQKKGQSPPPVRMGEMPLGVGLLEKIKTQWPDLDVIVCTGEIIESKPIIEIMKKGASDYFIKDTDLPGRLFKSIDTLLEKRRVTRERDRLATETCYHRQVQRNQREFLLPALQEKYHFRCMLGDSPAMQRVYRTIRLICERSPESTVLITGETGTGKELAAWSLHAYSPRRERIYVPVNVPALHQETIQSELFGHEKGAFTGAVSEKAGFFEQADSGSLFLDEIGDIPPEVQVDLLRVLEERKIRRMGAAQSRDVDVRIIAATNKDLREAVRAKDFREDLYHRLNVIPLEMPPLRERLEDLELLVNHFLGYQAIRQKHPFVPVMEKEAVDFLRKLPWEGNVRELANVIERVSLFCEDPRISAPAVEAVVARTIAAPLRIAAGLSLPQPLADLKEALQQERKRDFTDLDSEPLKQQVFVRAYVQRRGNLTDVMTDLAIARATTYDYFDRLGKGFLLKKLCEFRGNIQALAQSWNLSFADLTDAVSSQNRLLDYAIELSKQAGENLVQAAKGLGVNPEDFQAALDTLKTLKSWR